MFATHMRIADKFIPGTGKFNDLRSVGQVEKENIFPACGGPAYHLYAGGSGQDWRNVETIGKKQKQPVIECLVRGVGSYIYYVSVPGRMQSDRRFALHAVPAKGGQNLRPVQFNAFHYPSYKTIFVRSECELILFVSARFSRAGNTDTEIGRAHV